MREYQIQYKNGYEAGWVTFEYTYELEKALELLYIASSSDPNCDHRILLVTEEVICEYTGQEVTE